MNCNFLSKIFGIVEEGLRGSCCTNTKVGYSTRRGDRDWWDTAQWSRWGCFICLPIMMRCSTFLLFLQYIVSHERMQFFLLTIILYRRYHHSLMPLRAQHWVGLIAERSRTRIHALFDTNVCLLRALGYC